MKNKEFQNSVIDRNRNQPHINYSTQWLTEYCMTYLMAESVKDLADKVRNPNAIYEKELENQ